MSALVPVQFAVLRDGSEWILPLPAALLKGNDGFLRLAAGQSSATYVTGPFDAGVGSDWEQVKVDAQVPSGSRVALETFISHIPGAVPAWREEPGLHILLDRDPQPAPNQPATRRYLWLRLQLAGDGSASTPVLEQVQAQTTGPSYIEDLPAVYRREDRSTRFLERWLALFRSDMQGFEQALEDAHQLFDPRTARADHLLWIAQCLGFEPPEGLTPPQLRALLLRLPELYRRRGTIAGLADWVEVFSGLRPTILEAFRSRRIWQLGTQSLLGFDTMLAAGSPDGTIVPGLPVTDPGYLGLMRETFGGPSFDGVNQSPVVDRTLDFSAARPLSLFPTNAQGQTIQTATLRWSGQIRPRYAERHALSLRVAGVDALDDVRVQFWIDGRPLVEGALWIGSPVSPSGAVQVTPSVARDIPLQVSEVRWLTFRLEVRTTAKKLLVSLSWSSRSQRPEIVPAECLYALRDDRANTAPTRNTGFQIGSAVVGATGPQAPGDYGQGLFSDTAHLFTVLVPPSCECPPQRHRRVREALDAEKPAHTDYHLCFLKPRLRVGFQARLGIDAIVADGPPPARLDEAVLGRNTYLAGPKVQPIEKTPLGNSHLHSA